MGTVAGTLSLSTNKQVHKFLMAYYLYAGLRVAFSDLTCPLSSPTLSYPAALRNQWGVPLILYYLCTADLSLTLIVLSNRQLVMSEQM